MFKILRPLRSPFIRHKKFWWITTFLFAFPIYGIIWSLILRVVQFQVRNHFPLMSHQKATLYNL